MKSLSRLWRRLFPRRRERPLYAAWLPSRAGAVIGIAQSQGDLIVACEGGVWRLRPDLYLGFIIEQVIP